MTDACLLDRGKTRDIGTEGGTRPADKSLIDRRLDAPSPTSRGSSSCSSVSRRPPTDHFCPRLDRDHKRLGASVSLCQGWCATSDGPLAKRFELEVPQQFVRLAPDVDAGAPPDRPAWSDGRSPQKATVRAKILAIERSGQVTDRP